MRPLLPLELYSVFPSGKTHSQKLAQKKVEWSRALKMKCMEMHESWISDCTQSWSEYRRRWQKTQIPRILAFAIQHAFARAAPILTVNTYKFPIGSMNLNGAVKANPGDPGVYFAGIEVYGIGRTTVRANWKLQLHKSNRRRKNIKKSVLQGIGRYSGECKFQYSL